MPAEEGITPAYFNQFIGTSVYYEHMMSTLLTDGTKALGEKCGAFWLMDLVASIRPKLKHAPFAVLDLTVNLEERSGEVVVHNGNSPDEPEYGPYEEYHRQEIPFTDFPFPTQKLFIAPQAQYLVIYLPSEH